MFVSCFFCVTTDVAGLLLANSQGRHTGSYGRIKVFLSLVMLLIMAMITPSASETVNRVNYGVLFEKDRTVNAIYDYWTHTFQLKLPTLHGLEPYVLACEPEIHHNCRRYRKVFQKIDEVRHHFFINLNTTMERIVKLMPNNSIADSRSRSKRKVLEFVSELGHSIFGFATDKEISRVAKHIMAMESTQTELSSTMSKFTDDLSSYMTLSDTRYDKLRTAVSDNHGIISGLANQLQMLASQEQYDLELTVVLLTEQYNVMTLQAGLQDFMNGVHGLLQHKLSNHIIPYDDILHVITGINQKLSNNHTRLRVLDMAPNEIYKDVPFLWTLREQTLYVTMKFPLVASMASLTVYRIYYHPVPLNATTAHATILAEDKTHVAFSRDQLYYGFPTGRHDCK